MDNTRITRITRIPLPVDLIRQMDEAIVAGIGGYSTRTELIVDSIQERLLELGHETAPPLPVASIEPLPDVDANGSLAAPTAVEPLSLGGVTSTTTVGDDENISQAEGAPLFGMHNRDYPSLWVLRELAAMCVDGLVRLDEFWTSILPAAWEHGDRLAAYEKVNGVKSTALFPTNKSKTKAAETAFCTFAVGTIEEQINRGARIATSGPLFEWHAAGLKRGSDDELLIGPTPAGWRLLQQCPIVTVLEPHPAETAEIFVEHLATHPPADYNAMETILHILASGSADRSSLLEQVSQSWPDWSESQVSTNSAGYIARAREWGLVLPKQLKGVYVLSDFGHQLLANNSNSTSRKIS